MRVTFIDPDGQTHSVTGEPGESAMRCATNHLVPGIVGECGGAMACATCHGYVAEDWAAKPPSPAPDRRTRPAAIHSTACEREQTPSFDSARASPTRRSVVFEGDEEFFWCFLPC